MTTAFWRQWHRWLSLPATIFLLFAAVTGILVAGTEFFGEDEARREAARRLTSPVNAATAADAGSAAIAKAMSAVRAQAGEAPIDRVTVEFKSVPGAPARVTVLTGKPGGGEDRKLVLDAATGALLSSEAYADKPFLYRLHSGEAFGDGGLVVAMGWGLALVWLTLSGIVIYWRMRRKNAIGWQRVFW